MNFQIYSFTKKLKKVLKQSVTKSSGCEVKVIKLYSRTEKLTLVVECYAQLSPDCWLKFGSKNVNSVFY